MTISEIRQILESPYDRKIWKGFLQKQFTNNKLNAEDRTISLADKTLSKECLSLGNYEINEYTKIGIYEVELNEKVNITRNRVALRNLIKNLTKQVAGAMVVFVQGDKWRFSYISKRKIKNKETNLIQDKETDVKRYTYLFGKEEKALTAAQRFDQLIQKQKANLIGLLSLDDFEEAFSVEKLSKEFFANYKSVYEDFVQFLTGKRYEKKGSKYAEQTVSEPNWQLTNLFEKNEKQARDFVKRMMGRIVFLYFIQKKGWLSVGQGKKWGEGNHDYLYDLFKKSTQKDDFYAQELVPLFFKRLNDPDSENKAKQERFPYLNGGLFDDTQDRKYNKLQLPEAIFERMLNTFNNYNFTIYEDAPDEHTVAVDPEMLGHIFENLLEDNKDKGAFYTPKEIVHYMCKESLKAYLFAQDEKQYAHDWAKTTIHKIIQQEELNEEEIVFAEKNAYKIIDALEEVKICDPAIGSGAFPMGLLQEIFNAQIYLHALKGFKKDITDAQIKKRIIEESIYGVDIDAGAVDIARLRFWLSLVVDEQEPQPLPNLDFKIVCANTLIPLGQLKGLDMDAKASLAVKELEKIRHKFFNASSEEKINLEHQFKKVQTDLLNLRELTTKDNYTYYTKLYEFKPFEDKSCTWFDAWWMFGVKDGFDIVIGNPPYGFRTVLSNEDKIYFRKELKIPFSSGDSAELFVKICFDTLLKNNGFLSFIIPKKSLYGDAWEDTRLNYWKKYNLKFILDTGKSFENVLLEASAFGLQKNNKSTKVQLSFLDKNSEIKSFDNVLIEKVFAKNNTVQIYQVLFPTSIFEKIQNFSYDESMVEGKIGLAIGTEFYSDEVKDYKLLKGIDIEKWSVRSHRYLANQENLNWKNVEVFLKPKVICQRLVAFIENPIPHLKITATYDEEGILITNTLMSFELNQNIFPKFWLAYLNSKFLNWYAYNFVYSRAIRGMDFYNFYIQQLPIPKATDKQQNEIIKLVDEIALKKLENINISKLENEIDKLIYELYDLSNHEIDIIEGRRYTQYDGV